MKKDLVIIADYTQDASFDIDELCEVCRVQQQYINELINYGIIHPIHDETDRYYFDMDQLARVKKALRLQHDLELNLQGIAMVIELLDEREQLLSQLNVLEKHLLKKF